MDVQTNYVRVTVKGKIFQIAFNEELQPDESVVQRSQITGHLLIQLKKLKANELLTIKAKASPNKRSVDDAVNYSP